MSSLNIDDIIQIEEGLFNISESNCQDVAKLLSNKWNSLKDQINAILPAAINQRRFSYQYFAEVIKALPQFNRSILNFEMQLYLRNIEATDESIKLSSSVFPAGSIGYVILHDDLESLVQFSTFPNFDKMEISFCEADSWTAEKFNLIDAAAYFGAGECFKFLNFNGFKITQETAMRSVYGGNPEIAEYISQCGFSFDKYLKDAIICHRNEIIMWIMQQMNDFEPDFDLCLRYRNTSMIKYFIESGIYYESFMERAIIRRRRDVLQYLIDNGFENEIEGVQRPAVYYNM